MGEIFSIVPLEMWADKRLTLKQMRVLGVLFSFRGKNTDTVWPSRALIAGRCGMSPCHVSTATSELERLGWLQKDGKGGHSKSTRYTITVPELRDIETVSNSGTVPEGVTVPESGTGGVPESGTRLPVPESGTRKEQTIEQTREQTTSSVSPAKVKRKSALTLRAFLDDCKHQGVKPIGDDDPIFDYAEKVGICNEMLSVAWGEFKSRFLNSSKTQKDWRAHYRNAVKLNWYRLWFVQEGDAIRWTTAGEQARRAAA